ncbi:pentatricopeptide repeat-containing protein 2, mitochondrial-like [Haliotis cracherodii]|uniref:pentatricopeptide repeat-containing protein 2, mitochondrial-like n=1 Tax=Haliotis cracherodii TaxID=6455 RepID=UPI0039E74E89
MAALGRNAVSLSRCLLKLRPVSVSGQRFLLNGDILGLDNLRRVRVLTQDRLGTLKGSFMERMQNLTAREGQTIFTEDLKTTVAVTETDEDLETLVAMLKRFCADRAQDTEDSPRPYCFGPPVLRLLHIRNEVDKAVELFQDESLRSLFDNISSYMLIMDMLYKKGRYPEVVEYYKQLKEFGGDDFRYPINCMTLLFASLYKINTEESLTLSLKYLRDIQAARFRPSGRSLSFIAALAVNQGKPATGLEVCTSAPNHRIVGVVNIKMICYAQLDRVEEIVPWFRYLLKDERANLTWKNRIFSETISAVEEALARGSVELKQHILPLIDSLRADGFIRNDPLRAFLEAPVTRMLRTSDNFQQRNRSFNFSGPRSDNTESQGDFNKTF